MVDKLYHRANPRPSLRPIACFVVKIRFVFGHATPPIIEKLLSKGNLSVSFYAAVYTSMS